MNREDAGLLKLRKILLLKGAQSRLEKKIFNKSFVHDFGVKCEEREAKLFYTKIHYVWPNMHDFNIINILNKVRKNLGDCNETFSWRTLNVSLDEYKRLAFEFFEDLNPKYVEFINDFYAGKSTQLDEREPSSDKMTSHVSVSRKSRKLTLAPSNKIYGLLTVAHEFAHILTEQSQNFLLSTCDSINEIESLFIEKLYIDFLRDKEIISEEERHNLRKVKLNNLAFHIDTLFEEIEIFKQLGLEFSLNDLLEFKQDVQRKDNYLKLLKRMDIMVNGLNGKEIHGEFVFRYIIGEIVSTALYEDFLKQPHSVLCRFDEYLVQSAHLDLFDASQVLLGNNYKQKIADVWHVSNEKTK